jgi:hypothetical protein
VTYPEAKEMVLRICPTAYLYSYAVGKESGRSFIIVVDKDINCSHWAWMYRDKDYPLSIETFEKLVWIRAANTILKQMVKKLEQ